MRKGRYGHFYDSFLNDTSENLMKKIEESENSRKMA